MKKAIKVLSIILCLMIALSPVIFAVSIGNVQVSPDPSDVPNGVNEAGNSIVGIIQVIGIFVAVGALMAIGIKYMMGSAEEKAEYKKVMIPYLIGALLLFTASLFAKQIYDFAQKLF